MSLILTPCGGGGGGGGGDADTLNMMIDTKEAHTQHTLQKVHKSYEGGNIRHRMYIKGAKTI